MEAVLPDQVCILDADRRLEDGEVQGMDEVAEALPYQASLIKEGVQLEDCVAQGLDVETSGQVRPIEVGEQLEEGEVHGDHGTADGQVSPSYAGEQLVQLEDGEAQGLDEVVKAPPGQESLTYAGKQLEDGEAQGSECTPPEHQGTTLEVTQLLEKEFVGAVAPQGGPTGR